MLFSVEQALGREEIRGEANVPQNNKHSVDKIVRGPYLCSVSLTLYK